MIHSVLRLSFLLTVVSGLTGKIKGTVFMPDLKIGEEELGEERYTLELPCATSTYTSNSSFPKWGKVWRINGSETFDASRLTFINDNATLRIHSLRHIDNGIYDCCLHAYAYEDYLCFVTKLILGDKITAVTPATEAVANPTEASLPPAWNVDMVGMDTMNARDGNTYFIRLFDVNVTEINCLRDGNATNHLKMSNSFPSPMFSDALLPSFNASLHLGLYVCNGTFHSGNVTKIIPAEFEIIESMEPNEHAQLLEALAVKDFRSGNGRISIIVSLIILHISQL